MEPLLDASLLFMLVIGLVLLVMAVVYVLRPSERNLALMALGAAESLVPVFVSFASLTVAWLLVAIGMSRREQ